MIEAYLPVFRYATPLVWAALGETIGQRAGVINIGLEGMMLAAAYAAAVVALGPGGIGAGLLIGACVGLLLAALQAAFTIRGGHDQVVVGTAINLLALGITNTLFRQQFGASGELIRLPTIPLWMGAIDFVVVLGLIAVVATGYGLQKTKWGLALRAAGEYPPAVESGGFSVNRLRWQAALTSGAMAGVAGAYLSIGVAGSFAEGMTSGKGFVAIAMVTFGRWKPAWVYAASVFVGLTDLLQYALQGRSGIPFQFLVALPYVAALAVLIVMGRGTRVPAALGLPYRKEG
ncbi:MAG: ABC transporter permease [Fimbriimonadaceae bacterium]|nr:ABC transporter permease [Fimbriimonadaceae bacterium]